MENLQIFLLAIIQGITEFLPISSQSHLILITKLFGFEDQGLGFDIALHTGSLFAIMIYFRREISQILSISDEGKSYIKLIILGSIPLPIIAMVFIDFISQHMRTIDSIAYMTILFAIILYFADSQGRTQKNELKSISVYTIVFIGIMQALAIMPGVSRSGIVITAALFANFSREDSIKIAFLLSIPAIFMATVYQSMQLYGIEDTNILSEYFIGALLSFIASYLTIYFFISTINRISFTPYIIYRLLLGSFLLGI